MTFEYWLDRLRRRADEVRWRGRGVLLDPAAVAEATELWHAARPADLARPAPEEVARLTTAARWLAWLHGERHATAPGGVGEVPVAWEVTATAAELLDHASRSGDPVLFDTAIALYEAVIVMDDPANRPARTSNLGVAHRTRFLRTGDVAEIDLAIRIGEQAIAELRADDPNTVTMLAGLVTAYVARYAHHGQPADLHRAVQLGESAVGAMGPADPNRAVVLGNLTAAYWTRFGTTDAVADLDRAIEVGERAAVAVTDGDPNGGTVLTNLAAAHLARHQRTGDRADLDRAIAVGERAAAADPDGPNAAAIRSNLATACHTRYERTGDLADLDHAVAHAERTVALIPADHPDRSLVLSNLAAVYQARFDRADTVADLDRAVEYYRRTVAATPDGHPRRAIFLSNLGVALHTRYERLSEPGDLISAVEVEEQALAATPADHPDLAHRLSNLGVALQARYERFGDPSDLARAVDAARRGLAAAPAGHPLLARYLANLGTVLRARFDLAGRLSDLDESIGAAERAVAATPADHPDRAYRLSNLGLALQARYLRTGAVEDLDRAVDIGGAAVAATPADHPDLARHLSNLASAYEDRFRRTGNLPDLDRAIEHKRRVVAMTPADHGERPGRLSNLGVAYESRHGRGGNKSDVDNAVAVLREAVAATPGDDRANLALRRSNLSQAYRARYVQSGATADLDEAVDLAATAVATVPADHPERGRYLFHLAYCLRTRYLAADDRADLDRAIDSLHAAVAVTPDGHPAAAARLYLLGRCYQSAGIALDRRGLEDFAARVTAATTSRPFDRVWACWMFGRLAAAQDELDIARRLLDLAVAVLPSVAAREIRRADQEYQLGAQRGLVSEAVEVHSALGDPVAAVRTAEQGRGILLAAQLDLRTPLTDLQARHPDLANRFRQVRDLLSVSTEDIDRTGVARRYDAVLAEIRARPGFERFLLPPTGEPPRPPGGRTVVLVNAGRWRGDAVIVTAGEPVLVPLPGLRLSDVESHATDLVAAAADRTRFGGALRRQRVVSTVLGWLWDTAVGPILDQVRETRIWWLPTGLLGLLPLHAAGHPGQPGALDRVVSSYTPTLRALTHAAGRAPATARAQLTVALTRTPGLPDLPETAAEAAALGASASLLDERATVAAVRAALPGASWVHFACHADTDPDTPSEGGLSLSDGVLPISEISRLDLPSAELAYLSACSSGHAGRRHAEEVIHLASAFHLAGFRHVIASLWPLDDHIAAAAARRVYARLPPSPSADATARALRDVTLELRRENAERPDLWAALVHSGP